MRNDTPDFVKFYQRRAIPCWKYFMLPVWVLTCLATLAVSSSVYASLDPEARITKLRIEHAGEITFDYPFQWDNTSPILISPGDTVSMTLDVVKYASSTKQQTNQLGVAPTDFQVALAFTNTSGTRTYLKKVAPENDLEWQLVEWGEDDWQTSLVWQVPEDFLGNGFILFSYRNYQSKVALENVADVTIDNTSDPELEDLVELDSTEIEPVKVVAYDPGILAAADGEWVYLYGIRYWRPLHLAPDWRPYTYGRWHRTVYGITWRAYTPWEEYASHYGVWYYHQNYGWIVQVGQVWRPHRVTFYYDNVKHYVAWRPFLSYGLSIQSRAYIPYRRTVELGFVDYWEAAPSARVSIDYVAVPSNKFAFSISAGIGSLDISATIISAPAQRNVILPPPPLAPRPVVVHRPGPIAPHHGPGPVVRPKPVPVAPAPVLRHPVTPPGPRNIPPPRNQGPRAVPNNIPARQKAPNIARDPKPSNRIGPNPAYNKSTGPKVSTPKTPAPKISAPKNPAPAKAAPPSARPNQGQVKAPNRAATGPSSSITRPDNRGQIARGNSNPGLSAPRTNPSSSGQPRGNISAPSKSAPAASKSSHGRSGPSGGGHRR